MTSQPLAKSDRESNEDCWNHWINASSPIVLILSHSLCHSLFAIVTQPALKGSCSIFSFFFSILPPLLVAAPQTLRVALYLLFISCCRLLVPRLVILADHSLNCNPLLTFQRPVITPCECDCTKFQERLDRSSSSSFSCLSCADMTWAHPETVSAGLACCDTVCLAFKATDAFLPQYLWNARRCLFCLRSGLSGNMRKKLSVRVVFSNCISDSDPVCPLLQQKTDTFAQVLGCLPPALLPSHTPSYSLSSALHKWLIVLWRKLKCH